MNEILSLFLYVIENLRFKYPVCKKRALLKKLIDNVLGKKLDDKFPVIEAECIFQDCHIPGMGSARHSKVS